MNSNACPPPLPRQRVPLDGLGPRGAPEGYYTSRVLNSTFRYVKFVKKLRASEAEKRIADEDKKKMLNDQQTSDFFLRCDRKALIQNVARRVDLCFASYEEDLKQKRKQLMELYRMEEKENIRKFVVQAQAGTDALWQDKVDRLAFLKQKRKKEHEDKYRETPLSKCAHVTSCIVDLRAKETQQIQLYQMKEKQARKKSEQEFDNMWYEAAMKEADALTARMEHEAIERYRLDVACAMHSEQQREANRLQREREKERLRQETLALMAQFAEDERKEQEAARRQEEEREQELLELNKSLARQQELARKQQEDQKLIADTWNSLTTEGVAEVKAQEELIRRKQIELNLCNKQMMKQRDDLAKMENANDHLVNEYAKNARDKIDRRRCDYLLWSQKANRDVRTAMIDQIKERAQAREVLKQKLAEEEDYQRQVNHQINQLVVYKDQQDAAARKQHQRNLLDQIEYNKLLKERARQEELDQVKKFQLATKEYEEEIKEMLSRPFLSDQVHPFMKQMARGLKMQDNCPCSKPNYCKIDK